MLPQRDVEDQFLIAFKAKYMNSLQESLRTKLASFINRISFEDLPPQVVRQAKLCVLDLIGVSIVGNTQKTTSIVINLIAVTDRCKEATIWGSDRKVSILTASLINAVQGHAIDMDDGHRFANGHPGVVTIPAAVAIGERENLSGKALIEAVVLGYEVFIRLGSAANPDLLLKGFHTTATIGTFASAVVASKLLGLNNIQTENALALAGLQSAGLLEALSSGESGKSFQVGKASQSGVMSGLMAQKGADGPVDIFEGEKGFCRAFVGKECDNQAICKDFGKDFQITNVYCKQHAACRHIHTALDATAEIVSRHDLIPEEIESIEVETYSIANNLTGHISPADSVLGAKFSTPVSIALFLVFKKTNFSAYASQYLSDPMVRAIAEKIVVTVNPQRDVNYPRERSARVRIQTKNHFYEHEMPLPKGEPESPLSKDEFMHKFQQNALSLYSKTQVDKIRDIILDLENRKVREITELLVAPSAS
ncbi:MmgE/PrpD family protein [Thermodesulfobacteriota bacterium]